MVDADGKNSTNAKLSVPRTRFFRRRCDGGEREKKKKMGKERNENCTKIKYIRNRSFRTKFVSFYIFPFHE